MSRSSSAAYRCHIAPKNRCHKALKVTTKAAAIYRTTDIIEPFFCEYGLNPEYRALIEQHGLVVSGVGRDGEARVLELPDHPFFLATLYVPQAHTAAEHPHPLVAALVAAAGKRAAASV